MTKESFKVRVYSTGEAFLNDVYEYEQKFDLVLLDIMLPGMSGIEVCKFLRKKQNSIPVLMLTALSTEDDKVLGLDSGADDYITKPFGIKELLARIRAILRRKGKILTMETTDEMPSKLTNKERAILELLKLNRGRVVSKEEILNKVWSGQQVGRRTVDVHIKNIRSKLEDEGRRIKTVWGIGYKLE